ncbi:MAG: hypothetical protein JWP00_1595 [Chloroflexi bacterium]|nr:hypothetical protein [Chloroflexota bacterium]
MADRSTNLLPGSRIGPYELTGVLGQGGMATVYKAYQASLDRQVAVKVMADRYANDPTFGERFRREARSIARLHHPNILTVHDAGEDNGLLYIVMENIEGQTLREELNSNPLTLERTAKILEQVGAALHYANQKGIVHRDVKPSNVLIDHNNNRAVLSDFGIAKLVDSATAGLTGTNEGMGTPEYMSPEQAMGEALDGRSDEYSLAAMAFELLTGRPPYKADTPIAIVMGHVSKEIPSVREINGQISPALDAVIRKALSKKPADRYPTVADFIQAFQAALSNVPTGPQTLPVNYSQPPYNPANGPQPTYPPVITPGYPPSAQPTWHATPPPQPYTNQPGPAYNQPYAVNTPYQGIQKPRKSNSTGLLLGGVAGILVMTVVILGLILVLGDSEPSNPTATAQVAEATQAGPASQGGSPAAATTAAAITTAAPATTVAPEPAASGGGMPVESSLKEITADPEAQKSLEVPFAQLGKDVNLALYSSPTSVDKLISFYKDGPDGWAFVSDKTEGNNSYVFLVKDGKGGLVAAAPITKIFINAADTPASLRPSLKEGETFVFLADNIDISAVEDLAPATTTAAGAVTTRAATSPAPAAVKYKPYTSLSTLWQSEMPDGWSLSQSSGKFSQRDSFSQPDSVASIEVAIIKDEFSTKTQTQFDSYVESAVKYGDLSNVKREKKNVQEYAGWLVSADQKTTKGTFPIQWLFLNRKDSVMEVKLNVRSELGIQFLGVMGHFLDTLKIKADPVSFVSAKLAPDGVTPFKKFPSQEGKWTANVPDGWSFNTYFDKRSSSYSWNLESSFTLNVRWTASDFSAGDPVKLKKDAETAINIRKISEATIEERKVSGFPAVLVKGKRASLDKTQQPYVLLMVSTGKGGSYEIVQSVDKAAGQLYLQPVLDKFLATFQVTP